MIIFLLIFIFFNLRNFLKLKKGENLNNWMNLTKKERYKLSKQESMNYLNKRKILLEEIRKEYKKISKGKSKKI